MSKISRTDFLQSYRGQSLSLSRLDSTVNNQLWSAGGSGWGLSQTDLNRDGKISGQNELKALFDYVDGFDRDGSFHSLQTRTQTGQQTRSGKVMSVVEMLRSTATSSTTSPGTSPTPSHTNREWKKVARGEVTLRRGAEGPAVSQLQKMMSRLGYAVPENGKFDSTTATQLKAFQTTQGLSVDGVVGKNTVRELTLASVRKGIQELSSGEEGEVVRFMQQKLTSAGFGVGASGKFGSQTESVLKSFQRAHQIEETGRLGKTTLAALEEAAPVTTTTGTQSARGRQQMQEMLSWSKQNSQGRRPDGFCYSHVANYIDRVGYGKIAPGGFNANIPSPYWAEARQFAEFMNKDGNAERLGLKKLSIDNPYDAPEGAIVVVRAGTPGTYHRTAGDIAIKGEGRRLYNGGEMSYGGPWNFPPGNDLVLGIYVPQ